MLTRRELRAREAAAAAGLAAGAVTAAGGSDVDVPPLDEGPDVETPEGAVAGVVVDAEYVENGSASDVADETADAEAVGPTRPMERRLPNPSWANPRRRSTKPPRLKTKP